jgi:5'-3' exonuclease
MIKSLDDENSYEVVIVDFLNLFYRNFYVHKNFFDSKGRHSGGIFGTIQSLLYLKKNHPKSEFIIVHDTKPTIRLKIFNDYKGNRDRSNKEEANNEINVLKKILSYLDYEQYYSEGYEADDLADFFCGLFNDKRKLLLSTDKDWYQLLDDKTDIMRNNEIFTREKIEEKEGIDLDCYTLTKSILGDGSDNISGVFRINKKRTYELCKSCKEGTIFDLIEDIEVNKKFDSFYEKLYENLNQIKINYSLVKLRGLEKFTLCTIEKEKDIKKAIDLLDSYEIKSLIEKIKNIFV